MSRKTSLLNFMNVRGPLPESRYGPCQRWVESRRRANTLPYFRSLDSPVSSHVTLANGTTIAGRDDGNGEAAVPTTYLNYASQDYLGLVGDRRINEAAITAVNDYGVHSSGSPAFIGTHRRMLQLEELLCDITRRARCLLYPTGWAAGYGVVAALANRNDVIIMDQLAHNCLQQGARVCRNIYRFAHNDAEEAERLLKQQRAKSDSVGIFLILESLYSMDADSPDLPRIIALARRYNAIVIVDVAHDFGSMGQHGLGLLEGVDYAHEPDIITGSFSKTFASNGGFALCSSVIHNYLRYFSPSLLFSTAFSPIQATIILTAANIVFSEEGNSLRRRLMNNVLALRQAMTAQGIHVGGAPSPIVPAFVGEESVAQQASAHLAHNGLLANLVEFPAVPRGAARFRFQVMPTHTPDDARTAAAILARAVAAASDQVVAHAA